MTGLLSTAQNISRSETIFWMRASVEYETKLYFLSRYACRMRYCFTNSVPSIRHIMALYINECTYR